MEVILIFLPKCYLNTFLCCYHSTDKPNFVTSGSECVFPARTLKRNQNRNLPSILLMLELCMSGHALSILRRSSRAHTMKAFIGRLICGRVGSSRDPLFPLPGDPRIIFALYIFPENT